jgi:glutathione peroxidase
MKPLAFLFLAAVFGAPAMAARCPSLLSSKVTNMLGETGDLCEHAGKVLLVVNTASFCGYTPQYKGLQALHERYKSKGLVIVGFPSNDFGKQEPGSNKEIADFCDRTYAVKFEMFGKISVGPGASPLFDALASATRKRPEWNFHKYLVARDGKTVASYPSDVDPESPQFVAKVEELLR